MKLFEVETTKAVKPEDVALVVKYADLCLKELCRAEHELSGSRLSIVRARKHLKLKVRTSGQLSRGGKYGIKIDIVDTVCRIERSGRINEYKAFAKDPVIGSFACKSREKAIAWVVAHEVAHHAQYRYGPSTRWLRATYRKPHGHGFQAIYRILRSRVVNPIVDPNLDLKEAS